MYYLLGRSDDYPCRWIDDEPFIEDADFDLGIKITIPLPDPLKFSLKPLNPNANDEGPEMPELFDGCILLLSDDFIDVMKRGGVDNLDLYNALIYDPDTGEEYTNYKAVNIIGCIAAADMEKSNATVHPGGPYIDVDFDRLVLDESRTRGALIFRLAEATHAILVLEKLRDHLLAEGFTKLEFLDLEDIAL